MKKLLLVMLILLLSVTSASAILMRVNESYYSNGKNITFVGLDFLEKNADFCRNGLNKKIFFAREGVHEIDGVKLDIFDNGVSFIKVRIYVDPCQDCFCDKNCLNLACYNLKVPDCVDDRECDDNQTITEDRCLKNKCFNIAEEVKEDIGEREEELKEFTGVEEKKSNVTFFTTIILFLILVGVIVYFAFTRN